MSMLLQYVHAHRLDKLNDELLTALPGLQPVPDGQGGRVAVMTLSGDGTALTLWVPDDTIESAVRAVVDAHDPTTPSATEQQVTADSTSLSDLATTYAAMVTKLEAIQADMATLANHANTLSTVTITSFAQTQANLRALGTDLGMLVDDVNAFAVGSERVLKAVRVFVRRQGA